MAIPIMAIFVKKFQNHIKVEFLNSQEFTLVIICVVKNDNLGLEMKFLKVLGIKPNFETF